MRFGNYDILNNYILLFFIGFIWIVEIIVVKKIENVKKKVL